jgi:glutamyl-tRNA synthetase
MATDNKKIRTRFAPSPTGFVHIGSLRTALFSFLFARHNGGKHALRIEDTDQNRFVEGSLENLINIMKLVGVEFDEGPLIENGVIKQTGQYGPYIQSERKQQGIYQKYADQLMAEKKAYYCFCTEQRLEDLRKEQTALKKPPMYDRHCYRLTADEVQKQLAEFKSAGKNPVIRFFIPEGQTTIRDLIYGDITYHNSVLDDQVILKSDGFPTYHLAVVVDDHLMEISHVIRGEEWIPSTPKHLLLYKAFGWQPTEFAHLPLILNPDKSKLSKRQGDVSVEDFLTKGYLPEALLNFVAFLGWNPKTEKEIFSLTELTEEFDLSKVNKSGAVLDMNKLDWLNGLYIRSKSSEELRALLTPYLEKSGVDVKNFKHEYLEAIANLEKERLKKLSDIEQGSGYYFKQPHYEANLLVWKKSTPEDAKQKLSELMDLLSATDENKFTKNDLESSIKTFITEKNYDNGSVLWPLRVALTGKEKSPGPFEVCAVLALGLGKQEILDRIKIAIQKLT